MINESLLQSCGEYHSQTNSKRTLTTKNAGTENPRFYRNKEGLHNTLSVDLLTSGSRCQFSQNIHDFSQEICCMLKLMAQHDK